MGFRDLDCFNLALLAKQCWRIIKSPSSLVAQILKCKYFPQGSFLNSNLGSQPSYIWRSLLKGHEILSYGIRWKVGNGVSISIWQDKWIPTQPPFSLSSYSQGR